METRKNQHHERSPSFLYHGGGESRITPITSDDFEFDEADVWTPKDHAETKKSTLPNSKSSRKLPLKIGRSTSSAADHQKPFTGTSLPVNVPDWSKILRGEYKSGRRERKDDDVWNGDELEDDDDDDEIRLPPHEYLARTRIASFSVHEGVGRTLKGRDLSRVRNAIWKQTGFED